MVVSCAIGALRHKALLIPVIAMNARLREPVAQPVPLCDFWRSVRHAACFVLGRPELLGFRRPLAVKYIQSVRRGSWSKTVVLLLLLYLLLWLLRLLRLLC